MKRNISNLDSRTKYILFGIIVGGTYKFDFRPMGVDFHNYDIRGTIITVLLMVVILMYLYSQTVQETFVADND